MNLSTTRAKDGCMLHFNTQGRGPAVLLIPGLGGSSAFWTATRGYLANRFCTISMDHRGAGLSDRPEGVYQIQQIADDALAVLDALGEGAVTVVGHSTGGAVAQCVTLDAPGRVSRLVLSGTWERPDARFRLMFETRLRVLNEAGPACYQELTHALCFPARWIADHRADLAAAVGSSAAALFPLSVAAARIRMLLTIDRAAELGRIAVPTLVVGAPDDALIPFYHSERLASAIPGAKLASLAGGHFFPRVEPKAYAQLLTEFLEAD